MKISDKIDKVSLVMFLGWLIFWIILVFKDVGGTTGGPFPIYWYDVLYLPFVAVIFPAILGIGIFHKIIIDAFKNTEQISSADLAIKPPSC